MDNPANTNIVSHAGRILALCEAGLPYEVTPHSTPSAAVTSTAGCTRMTAHPKFDPETGEMLFSGYHPGRPSFTYHVADPTGGCPDEVIDIHGPSMVHDFATRATTSSSSTCRSSSTSASPAGVAALRVAPRVRRAGRRDAAGRRQRRREWFEVEPCYVFHPLNAYDEGDQVIVDVVRYARCARRAWGSVEEAPPRLDRWILDLERGTALELQLDDRPMEFPRVDDRVAG